MQPFLIHPTHVRRECWGLMFVPGFLAFIFLFFSHTPFAPNARVGCAPIVLRCHAHSLGTSALYPQTNPGKLIVLEGISHTSCLISSVLAPMLPSSVRSTKNQNDESVLKPCGITCRRKRRINSSAFRHIVSWLVLAIVVLLITKGYITIGDVQNSVIGYRNPVGVTTNIFDHLFWDWQRVL